MSTNDMLLLSFVHDKEVTDVLFNRSGKYVYKPTMDVTCCPQYAIRCPVEDFKMSKSHKKIIKRNNRFFNTGVGPSKQELQETKDSEMIAECDFSSCNEASLKHHEINKSEVEQPTSVAQPVSDPSSSTSSSTATHNTEAVRSELTSSAKESSQHVKKKPKPGQSS